MPRAPKTPADNVTNPQEEAVQKAAANVAPSKTAEAPDNAADDPTGAADRSAEAGHVRPSVPDEFAGIAEPSTDPNKTTKQ